MTTLVPPKRAENTTEPGHPHGPGQSPPDHLHEQHHAAYAAEASGLLLVAVVLLILTVVRYWQSISWVAH